MIVMGGAETKPLSTAPPATQTFYEACTRCLDCLQPQRVGT